MQFSGKVKQFLGLGAWLSAALTGMLLLGAYSQRPGAIGNTPEELPATEAISADSARMQLVMFVHPQCACSRASLGELATLLRRTHDKIHAEVLFIAPEGQSSDWVQSDLWRQAEQIPDVSVRIDADGAQAARFGAETSGTTLVYDREQHLVFKGGITAARGHFGDNVGRLAIEQWTEGSSATTSTPVFGCPLTESERKQERSETPEV